MTIWFRRADADHDGTISRSEFEADAERWFAIVDTDHDDFIEPSETAAAHAKLMPWAQSRDEREHEEDEELARERREAEEANLPPPPQQRDRQGFPVVQNRAPRRSYGVSIDLDPIMAADANLDNKVSKAEFMAMAERHFDALDLKHDELLTLAEVVTKCEADERDWAAAEANSRR